MSTVFEATMLGLRAALADISSTLLRPVRNLEVALGLKQEKSLRKLIEEVSKRDQAEPPAPRPGEPA